MWCPSCREEWPGHKRCPSCERRLVDMKTMLSQTRIEDLPRLRDLARQYALGQAEREDVAPSDPDGGEEDLVDEAAWGIE